MGPLEGDNCLCAFNNEHEHLLFGHQIPMLVGGKLEDHKYEHEDEPDETNT